MKSLSILFLAGSVLTAPRAARSSSHLPRGDSIDYILPPIVPINTRSGDRDLISRIITAPPQAKQVELLNRPGDYVFDFKAGTGAGEAHGKGSRSVSATALTMPALIGNGASMTVVFLGPCGMNTAHVHNRATELNIVVKGRLVTNFVVENGAKPIANTMDTFQVTVFPQGTIHQEFNPDCEDAVFVAAFDNADPGVNQIAQNFFALNGDVVQATLGGMQTINGKDIEFFRSHIPANIALGIDACLNKCGIMRNARRDISELLN
ncbi:RmlC-like cupin domain-containing protein [Fusarium oxysporum Fo47]|uniref:Uncharacterized protein n=1 Tax=Fusarium oxysporum Fo47 TaxID=660027 RepID=W9J7D7_FUSOX|nr:RmlC-like cupin domain-containing protein [Fusarium oxysporum Fo47]EWZ27952.1 hypothetical protein FOZG_18338 [Fusarium oxysporum Fo47]QKD57192.1 RmlC-like cupin domain-containing protein [Fusarium oxysporum Fo47]